MSIELDKLKDSFKSKMLCSFCNGTGLNNWDIQKNITLFGKTPKEISDILNYAYEHGYKKG